MTVVDKGKWERDGYYVLPKFYSDDEVDRIKQAQGDAWATQAPRITVDNIVNGKRSTIADVTDEERRLHWFKTNDLYLEKADVLNAGVNPRITPILKELLGTTPVLCNSLNFTKGSTQGVHADSLYMTPPTDGHLIAIWVALEDCSPDAGPLFYYPGSNRIAPYVFSDGRRNAIGAEMAQWNAYVSENIEKLGLKREEFPARKGDVFVWSCNLLHGGSPIKNNDLTRNSLVMHYFSESDCRAKGFDLVPKDGAYWMYRAHPAIGSEPGSLPPRPQ